MKLRIPLLAAALLAAFSCNAQTPGPETVDHQLSRALPALVEALHDPDPAVRDAAALALREYGPRAKSSLPALARLLRDSDGYVRITAARVLERLGPDSIQFITPLLRDGDPRVRALAAQVIRQIAADAAVNDTRTKRR